MIRRGNNDGRGMLCIGLSPTAYAVYFKKDVIQKEKESKIRHIYKRYMNCTATL